MFVEDPATRTYAPHTDNVSPKLNHLSHAAHSDTDSLQSLHHDFDHRFENAARDQGSLLEDDLGEIRRWAGEKRCGFAFEVLIEKGKEITVDDVNHTPGRNLAGHAHSFGDGKHVGIV